MIAKTKEHYTIFSGEGCGEGRGRKVFTTKRGLKILLTKERCGGDRWAFAVANDGGKIR